MRSHQDDLGAPDYSVLHIIGDQRWGGCFGVLYQGFEGSGRHSGIAPSVTPGSSVSRPLHVSAFLHVPGPTLPKAVQFWPRAVTTRLPGKQSLTISFPFPHFLPTPEEDPCACESIVKFQTKVEGLLQALTRKHILSQKPLRGGGEVRRALWAGGGEPCPLCGGVGQDPAEDGLDPGPGGWPWLWY